MSQCVCLQCCNLFYGYIRAKFSALVQGHGLAWIGTNLRKAAGNSAVTSATFCGVIEDAQVCHRSKIVTSAMSDSESRWARMTNAALVWIITCFSNRRLNKVGKHLSRQTLPEWAVFCFTKKVVGHRGVLIEDAGLIRGHAIG